MTTETLSRIDETPADWERSSQQDAMRWEPSPFPSLPDQQVKTARQVAHDTGLDGYAAWLVVADVREWGLASPYARLVWPDGPKEETVTMTVTVTYDRQRYAKPQLWRLGLAALFLLGVLGNIRNTCYMAGHGYTVKREGRRWYVVLSCGDMPARPLPETGAVVGIDLGVASFLTTSDGTHVPNPRPLAATAARLAAAQQALARKKRGSTRRRKTVTRVVALHGKVRRARLDHAHKTALALVRMHDVICHEALNVAGMTRRPKPRPAADGTWKPNGAVAKSGLNKSILDAGWRVFLNVLRAKAESAGRVVTEVNPCHTSQMCSECGHVAAGNRITQAAFKCLSCGHEAHADVNAAINILRAGLARQEAENAA